MNIETRKISFIQEFLRVQNEEIVIRLEKLLKKQKSEHYENELKPMDLNQFNDEIDQALVDSENDRVIKASELKRKWN
ncbi:MAG: hypothetical protein B6D61_02120 [Bacteroidetes bacterium 4484_249]|nr:MAG: hypothetical protein B6D61_02120 [Bacteroidetes bacterium 4484_249]